MSQFPGLTQAALDYDFTIIGALELSEKKWLFAVQLPGVIRHSRHVLNAGGDELAAFIERLKTRCATAGRTIARVILTHEAGRDGFWLARFLEPTRHRSPSDPAVEPPQWTGGHGGRRPDVIDVEMLLRTLMAWLRGEPSCLFDGADLCWKPTRKRGERIGNGRNFLDRRTAINRQ